MSNDIQNRIPPQSLEMEQAVLGSLLIAPGFSTVSEVLDIIDAEDFYRPAHAAIYNAIIAVASRASDGSVQPVDLLTVTEMLRCSDLLEEIGGSPYLVHLTDTCPTSTNAAVYARVVRDRATMRRLDAAGRRISGLAHLEFDDVSDVLMQAERELSAASDRATQCVVRDLREVSEEILRDVSARGTDGEVRDCYRRSGFHGLDRCIGGLETGTLTVLAARPSVGKTAFAMQISDHVADIYGPVLFVSMEMSERQLQERRLSYASRIEAMDIRCGRLSVQDREALRRASDRIRNRPIYVRADGAATVASVREAVREAVRCDKSGLELVVIDYLQLMDGSKRADNRNLEIAQITRQLKQLAVSINVPILLLSQLSRECNRRANRRPELSDLRDSGAIEQDADVVLFLYRDGYYDTGREYDERPDQEDAEVIIAKNRSGPTGTEMLGYRPRTAEFVNLLPATQERSYSKYTHAHASAAATDDNDPFGD